MFAVIYLIVMLMVGDLICRRFYSFVSLPHRLAAAFLSGLLFSTWLTYLGALLFTRASQPLLWGNLLFFAAAFGFILWSRQNSPKVQPHQSVSSSATKADRVDWIVIGLFLIFAGWQMFGTLNMSDGKLLISNHQWSDFGSNIPLMQSFALGHNFPTEYPHFSGERIRYHFLFYFQAGNLEYLGLNPALSNNILSILSLLSMLILVMTLGVVLFGSRVVGRIGAALFFFHGSLSFIPFIFSHRSIGDAVNAALTARDFLPSGFDYRGELWGVWSQVVFLNQRHLATSIGLLLLVLVFLITRYRAALFLNETPHSAPENNQIYDDQSAANDAAAERSDPEGGWLNGKLKTAAPFIFSGVLLGLLPMFNSAIFLAAFAVLAVLFVLFPLKKQMLWLAATTALVALPQVLFLKTGNMREAGYSLFHWGYTVENPTLLNVIEYLGFTFGFKWLLIALALYLATQFERRVMIAISSLIALAFFFQFSDEVLANHKFLNFWLIIANLFVAYGLWRLWNMTWLNSALPGKIVAVVLTALITVGGIIDLFPIHNGYWMEMPFEGDSLVRWVRDETDPKAIFLSHRFVNHRIMLAGRRVFYGHPYYAWSAGYPTAERDVVYKQMFEQRNLQELLRLLQANNISYVAIDDAIRNGDFIKNLNEAVFESNFEQVFRDAENRYDGLAIFKVPVNLSDVSSASLLQKSTDEDAAPVSAFEGGEGRGRGQFDKPRGIAANAAGNLYVADSGNSRVQKFSPDGGFLEAFGKSGARGGELREPNGIAVDSAGKIYVADALNHRLIKFNTDGGFEKEWSGPAPGFYGPRDIAIGPDKKFYILDQGRSRVVKFDPESENFAEWGQKGTGAGEFNDATGLAVGGDRVFVTDAGNNRIQVFDLDGKFISQWGVPEWDKYLWHYPDAAFDSQTRRLYVTSGWTKEILVFDADGNRLDSLKPAKEAAKLDNPSSLVLVETKKSGNRLYVLDTGEARVSVFELGRSKPQK